MANILKLFVVFLIKVYQVLLSPLLPPSCNYSPSCSEYACQAFSRYGLVKGLWLSARRVAKCNPFGQGGFDPLK
ncbi:MAG: membrane protein insertion efficiency factor YidD [Candidatus Schekmanbacteria bacterium RIFCSPHIGHO2_02_FULL_38_11]|uniref:Putative membrane protein insertion efficiency factor n=1 Tax=Candidatus Schekmanbacteria bacterium RIFCSPLOWO2_12_FULL_38_15 TaxID=1817883 RepID=A0A1F7SKE6_9BACT|nr:MAG: membrane protein insertion efficiency factor YidD [Candidatus Schekmanbacteria bacterium GWA2_38_9]OGL48318.1 MAG: membrane protein insertion efficiency factor YidD [Candidatus Schekmanbacteria bacterium RIFCSPLOWO2_02_FULL_38_14]OGL49953.1 MAG: membrane protein insertion efficiency factor YidD [Candidatus Schekmanbacteria bacterium RIFCSPHIGHO2_02_FULL_38_11]OGL54235.1 MAG: membrane protein insertion efficiency factor YidD [Candidatus Schekmanbacteria bacterium RIFCSPLOWO2_12_FULL_38_15